MSSTEPRSVAVSNRPAAWSIVVLLILIAATPLALRAVNRALPDANERPSFVPSVETPRPRFAFDEPRAEEIRKSRPEYVIIGDSTAGGRINPGYLSRLVHHGVAGLYHPGSPVAYWFLVFKNFVVENNVSSVRGALIFFRDDQLTSQVESSPRFLDNVARDYEPELDRVWGAYKNGKFSELHRAARTAYQYDRTRVWLEPQLTHAPARLFVAPDAAAGLVDGVNNNLFTLDRLRHFAAADLAASSDEMLDFDANVNRSLLPAFFELAQRRNIRLGFIRVQRRPTADGPPQESAALRAYLERFQAYLEEHGAYYGDDWGDPDQPLSIYSDGDHLRPDAMNPYTERFARKHASFFQ